MIYARSCPAVGEWPNFKPASMPASAEPGKNLPLSGEHRVADKIADALAGFVDDIDKVDVP